MAPPEILVIDDQVFFQRGLEHVLGETFPGCTVALASEGDAAVRLAGQRRFDVVLLSADVAGQEPKRVLDEIRAHQPTVPILLLGDSNQKKAIRGLKAGASGYFSKQESASELRKAIETVRTGKIYVAAATAEALAQGLREAEATEPELKNLSKRELQVFKQIARGLILKEVAAELSLSDKTVSTYFQRIKQKTGLASYVEIARYALSHNLPEV